MPQRRRVLSWLAAAMLVAGCLPRPVTGEAEQIAWLYWVAMGLSGIVLLVVWVPLGIALLRYRRRRRDEGLPPQTRGSTVLEIAWTVGPLITILVLFALTLAVLDATSRPDGEVAGDQVGDEAPVVLDVVGFRWGWQMIYPDAGVVVSGVRAPGPTAVLPVGRPVLVRLTAVDVLHAFHVPQFLYKRDAVPGRVNEFPLTIQQPGTYAGQCAEFCGIFHDQMPFTIQAVEPAEFEQWLADEAARQQQVPVPTVAP